MALQTVMDNVDSVVMIRKVMCMQEPNMEVVAMIAWSEV